MSNKRTIRVGKNRGRRRFPLSVCTAPVMLMISLSASAVETESAALDWATISRTAPEGLLEKANEKRSAVFFMAQSTRFGMARQAGFFVGDEGLALCLVPPLCRPEKIKFFLADDDQTALDLPKVLAVFPKEEMALLKFSRRPSSAASLPISETATPVGAWVVVVPPELAPGPVAGPILSHRTSSVDWEMKFPASPAKQFSIAMGHGPSQVAARFRGAPLLNSRGEVVAVFGGSVPLGDQTFQLAIPTEGLPQRIAEAVKKDEGLKVPLQPQAHGLDAAELSDEWYALQSARMRSDDSEVQLHSAALLKHHPRSFLAQKQEYIGASIGVRSGAVSPQELVKLARGLASRAETHPAARAFYLAALGDALLIVGDEKEAISALKESHELSPGSMACGTLAQHYMRKGQWNEAERFYRQAISVTPERIAFWDQFEGVLFSLGKTNKSREIFERVLLLEDLYSGR